MGTPGIYTETLAMAQTGFTPILLYSSSTASQAPSVGNLTNSTLGSELAINITDGKLFYKDNANAVQVIAWKVTPTTAGGTGLTSYTAGDLLYYATGTTLSKLGIGASKTILTSSGTAPQWSASLDTTQGGTGLTSYTAGDLVYYASGTTLTKLAIGTSNRVLTSSGTAPQWSLQSSLSVGSADKWTTARNLAGNSVDGSANVAFANKFIVQGTTDTGLSGAQFLGSLATGIVKNTTTTGVLSIATAGTDYVAPATGQVLQVKVATYAPAALKDLYTGTNTDALYYNTDFNQTVTGLTAGSTLIVSVCGGRLLLNNVGDAFAWYLEIDGTDVTCGVSYVEGIPVMIQGYKTNISGSSVTVKLGGFSRYDNRTPLLDLRTNISNDNTGNGVLGDSLKWVFTEVKA